MKHRILSRRDRIRRVGAIVSLIVMLSLLSIGCQSDPTGGHGEEVFPGETGQRSFNQFADAQAAAGARQDATLRAMHFDGNALNSLGREKLDQMLYEEDAPRPIVIWIDADEAVASNRGKSIAAYLEEAGLATTEFEFKTGENPDNFSPVAPNLARMGKTETGENPMAEESSMSGDSEDSESSTGQLLE